MKNSHIHIAKNLPQELRRPIERISCGSPNISQFLPAECRRNIKCPKGKLPTSLRGISSWEFRGNSKGRPNRNVMYIKISNYLHKYLIIYQNYLQNWILQFLNRNLNLTAHFVNQNYSHLIDPNYGQWAGPQKLLKILILSLTF